MLARSTVKSIVLSARSRVLIPIPQSVCIPTIPRDHATMCEYNYKSREPTSRMAYLGKCNFVFLSVDLSNLSKSCPVLTVLVQYWCIISLLMLFYFKILLF